MDLREAAGALGVHYQTAYAWVRQGILPARKAGRGYAVSDGDVAALAAAAASAPSLPGPSGSVTGRPRHRAYTRRSPKVRRPWPATGSAGWRAGCA
jgi:excisionase family DNA binding protein